MLGNRSAAGCPEIGNVPVSGATHGPDIPLPDTHFIPVGRYALPGGPTVDLSGQAGPDYGEMQELLSSPTLAPRCASPDVVLQYACLPNAQEALWRDGRLLALGPRTIGEGFNLVFEIVLALLAQHDLLCILHGSAVEWQDKRVVFMGVSGSGKSTLAALFAAHGARYIGDDYVAVLRDGSLVPVPLAPSIKSGSLPILVPLFPALGSSVERVQGGKAYRYLSNAPWATRGGKIDLIAFPVFSATASPKSVDLTDIEVLLNLAQAGVWVPPECFETFLGVILDTRAIAMRHTPDFSATKALLRQTLERTS